MALSSLDQSLERFPPWFLLGVISREAKRTICLMSTIHTSLQRSLKTFRGKSQRVSHCSMEGAAAVPKGWGIKTRRLRTRELMSFHQSAPDKCLMMVQSTILCDCLNTAIPS